MRKVTVTIHNDEFEYEAGIPYEQVAKDFQKDYEAKIVLVSVNGRLRELHKILSNDCTIEFITIAEKIGMETYRRSATFLLVKAVHDVIGDDRKNHIVAQYTVGRGLLCKLLDVKPTEQFIRSVHARMDELISQNIPIWKTSYSVEEARRIFAEAGMEDKVRLFKFRRASKVNVIPSVITRITTTDTWCRRQVISRTMICSHMMKASSYSYLQDILRTLFQTGSIRRRSRRLSRIRATGVRASA